MVNIYKPKLTNLQQGILRLLFFKTGSLLNQRQIARMLDVTPPAVMKAIPRLEKEGLIAIQQDAESKRWTIGLNRNNHKTLQLKRADNLKAVYESGLADFIEKEFAGATIILFGSYSRGEDTITSDIDIAIIGRNDKKVDFSALERILARKININFYKSWNGIHTHLKENIFNGIVLAGGTKL